MGRQTPPCTSIHHPEAHAHAQPCGQSWASGCVNAMFNLLHGKLLPVKLPPSSAVHPWHPSERSDGHASARAHARGPSKRTCTQPPSAAAPSPCKRPRREHLPPSVQPPQPQPQPPPPPQQHSMLTRQSPRVRAQPLSPPALSASHPRAIPAQQAKPSRPGAALQGRGEAQMTRCTPRVHPNHSSPVVHPIQSNRRVPPNHSSPNIVSQAAPPAPAETGATAAAGPITVTAAAPQPPLLSSGGGQVAAQGRPQDGDCSLPGDETGSLPQDGTRRLTQDGTSPTPQAPGEALSLDQACPAHQPKASSKDLQQGQACPELLCVPLQPPALGKALMLGGACLELGVPPPHPQATGEAQHLSIHALQKQEEGEGGGEWVAGEGGKQEEQGEQADWKAGSQGEEGEWADGKGGSQGVEGERGAGQEGAPAAAVRAGPAPRIRNRRVGVRELRVLRKEGWVGMDLTSADRLTRLGALSGKGRVSVTEARAFRRKAARGTEVLAQARQRGAETGRRREEPVTASRGREGRAGQARGQRRQRQLQQLPIPGLGQGRNWQVGDLQGWGGEGPAAGQDEGPGDLKQQQQLGPSSYVVPLIDTGAVQQRVPPVAQSQDGAFGFGGSASAASLHPQGLLSVPTTRLTRAAASCAPAGRFARSPALAAVLTAHPTTTARGARPGSAALPAVPSPPQPSFAFAPSPQRSPGRGQGAPSPPLAATAAAATAVRDPPYPMSRVVRCPTSEPIAPPATGLGCAGAQAFTLHAADGEGPSCITAAAICAAVTAVVGGPRLHAPPAPAAPSIPSACPAPACPFLPGPTARSGRPAVTAILDIRLFSGRVTWPDAGWRRNQMASSTGDRPLVSLTRDHSGSAPSDASGPSWCATAAAGLHMDPGASSQAPRSSDARGPMQGAATAAAAAAGRGGRGALGGGVPPPAPQSPPAAPAAAAGMTRQGLLLGWVGLKDGEVRRQRLVGGTAPGVGGYRLLVGRGSMDGALLRRGPLLGPATALVAAPKRRGRPKKSAAAAPPPQVVAAPPPPNAGAAAPACALLRLRTHRFKQRHPMRLSVVLPPPAAAGGAGSPPAWEGQAAAHGEEAAEGMPKFQGLGRRPRAAVPAGLGGRGGCAAGARVRPGGKRVTWASVPAPACLLLGREGHEGCTTVGPEREGRMTTMGGGGGRRVRSRSPEGSAGGPKRVRGKGPGPEGEGIQSVRSALSPDCERDHGEGLGSSPKPWVQVKSPRLILSPKRVRVRAHGRAGVAQGADPGSSVSPGQGRGRGPESSPLSPQCVRARVRIRARGRGSAPSPKDVRVRAKGAAGTVKPEPTNQGFELGPRPGPGVQKRVRSRGGKPGPKGRGTGGAAAAVQVGGGQAVAGYARGNQVVSGYKRGDQVVSGYRRGAQIVSGYKRRKRGTASAVSPKSGDRETAAKEG